MYREQGLRGHGRVLSSTAEIAETDSQRSDGANRRATAAGDARGMERANATCVCGRRNYGAAPAFRRTGEGVPPWEQSTRGESLAGDADRGIPRCIQWTGSATELGTDVWGWGGERASVGRTSSGKSAGRWSGVRGRKFWDFLLC